MRATLIGGMTRLRKDYIAAAARAGVRLTALSGSEKDVAARIGATDRLIVFTNMISHSARNKAVHAARSRHIPVTMAHSCGVSTLSNLLGAA